MAIGQLVGIFALTSPFKVSSPLGLGSVGRPRISTPSNYEIDMGPMMDGTVACGEDAGIGWPQPEGDLGASTLPVGLSALGVELGKGRFAGIGGRGSRSIIVRMYASNLASQSSGALFGKKAAVRVRDSG